MADISDVLLALRDAAAAQLYPAGTTKPGAIAANVRVYVGWPDASLDTDLAANVCHLSLWPRGTAATLPHKLDGWRPRPTSAPTLTAVVDGETLTLGGNASLPGMLLTVTVDRQGYTVAPAATDTPATLAAALAAKISADRAASAAGSVLTVPGAFFLAARLAVGGSERRELHRSRHSVQLTAWAPSPVLRDGLASLLRVGFLRAPAVPLPDGTSAFLTAEGDLFHDEARKQPLYRRDLLLGAEFAVTDTRDALPGITGAAGSAGLVRDLTQTPPLVRTVIIA